MTTTFSGTYIGSAGTEMDPAGAGLTLKKNTQGYTLTSTALALGGAGYGGTDAPNGGNGGVGIDITGGWLSNYGAITGGNGGFAINGGTATGGNGGDGISFASTGTFVNHGNVRGGLGAHGGTSGTSGIGGTAVDFLKNGTVINDGQITGGQGGSETAEEGPNPATGGMAIYIGGKGSLLNGGTITGGEGGFGTYNQGPDGTGGAGVVIAKAGLITNTGVIFGGAGAAAILDTIGGTGAIGVQLEENGILLNSGAITGGAGGNAKYSFATFASGGMGGIGLQLGTGATLINSGIIAGGKGGDVGYNYHGSGRGGAGIYVISSATVINSGTITGGESGVPLDRQGRDNPHAFGGAGVNLANGYLLNSGLIAGGNGDQQGGTGGDGIVLGGGSKPNINYGSIKGGNGYANGLAIDDYAGTGIVMTKPGVFVNFGTISSGSGSSGEADTNDAGIILAGGGTLINYGTINGKYTVRFGNAGSSHLVIDADAKFSSYVRAYGGNNVVELTGSTFGTLANIQYFARGFQTIQIDAGSNWGLTGLVSNLQNAGTLEIENGTQLDVSATDPNSTGVFILTGKSSLEIGVLLGSKSQIEFLGASPRNLLTIDKPAYFGLRVSDRNYAGPLIEDFSAGDVIDLKNIGSIGLTLKYNPGNGLLQVTSSSGGAVASLKFQNSSLGAGSFHLATDSNGGSLLTLV